MAHTTTNPKVRQIPDSTPEEIAKAKEIVTKQLGPQFWLEFDLPRNVGVKGDMGVWGETILIATDDEVAFKALFATVEAQNRVAQVSTELTNTMKAVTRVLIDITSWPRPGAA